MRGTEVGILFGAYHHRFVELTAARIIPNIHQPPIDQDHVRNLHLACFTFVLVEEEEILNFGPRPAGSSSNSGRPTTHPASNLT